jgi:L-arabinose transport system ATP-binding protein
MTSGQAESGLEFRGISKSFPGVQALKGVSFSAAPGSVHALLGENGAGKSTLLKILAGVYTPTAGELGINGEGRVFGSTAASLAAGVAIIHQELHLVPEMSVAENLFLGHTPQTGGMVSWHTLMARSRALLDMLGEKFDPGVKVSRLSIGQRQMVEIGKALSRNARIIAFDEPTSSLSDREVDRLFEVIRDLKSRGHVILYVTHRMKEIFELCDAATVLRDGAHVETFASLEGIDQDTLIQKMVGRNLTDIYNWKPRPKGDVKLRVAGVAGPRVVKPASFEVAAGEIVGVFGLVGAGRSELMKLIYGGERRTGGVVDVDGAPIDNDTPADAIRKGLVFCPEDRKKEGIFPVLSVGENVNISARRRSALAGFFIRGGWERANAAEFVKKLGVRTPSIQQAIMNLSGGNQQKVILARWLSEQIKVIILDEPTRGIDVGAKSEIYSIIYSLAEAGIAVVVVSSELPEVLGLSDRVLVMNSGSIVKSVPREEANQESLLALALPQAVAGAA